VTRTDGCLPEPTIAELARGQLTPAAKAGATAHLEGCASCRLRLSETITVVGGGGDALAVGTAALANMFVPKPRKLPADDAPTLARGTTVGRYTILELVGRGGMGEVYAAYDPELDRRIALKLLRLEPVEGESRAEARLLREAKAIARVSHANVVTVHDTGTFAGRVFIAMEFVDGATLKDWLEAQPRTRAEILHVFVAAARGLAAAHAAGLVHRDFKPHNVMVGNDGDVRVMDFGIVRQVGSAEDGPARAPADLLATEASFELTQTGELLGTPRYMAPEQFKTEPTDARTDQFSFCVALYEALYGQRAFDGDTLPVLMTNVISGRVSPPPSKAGVPGWLRRILLRGLETDRERRFPSMPALIAALETDPTVRARWMGAAAGLVACAVVAVVGARHVAGQRVTPCRGGAQRWSAIWEAGGGGAAPRRDAVRSAFVATGRAYAEQAFAGVAHTLDEYERSWVGMYTEACEATHVRGEQSPEVLDLRMACLNDRLTSAQAVTDLFTRADATVVENAVSAAAALPRLDRCANVAALKLVVEPPDSEALRARVDVLRGERARLVALRDAVLCQQAEGLAETLIPRTRATGYLPLVADTLNAAGMMSDQCVAASIGVARFEQAFTVALAARYDESAAEAALLAAGVYASRTDQIGRARYWLEVSAAMLRRFDKHPLLDAWYLVSEGLVLLGEGRFRESADAFQRSRVAKEKLLGRDNYDVIMSIMDVGDALQRGGYHGEALAATREAREASERTLGADHPLVAMLWSNEGDDLNTLRRPLEAEAAFRRSLAVWRKGGADPKFVSYGLTGLGIALIGEARPPDAVPPLLEALAIRVDKHLDVDLVNETRLALARALWAAPAERARARALAETARAELAKSPAAASHTVLTSVDAWLAAPSSRL